MLNSKIAIEIQSNKPLALLQHTKSKFLANLQALASDEQLARRIQKFALTKSFDGVKFEKKADEADDELTAILEQAMQSINLPSVTANGTGCICIDGVIGKNLSAMEKMIGCTDLNDVCAAIADFESRPEVKRIAFKINSGGGTTTGLQETADKIFKMKKPTAAFSDEDMGSAAFWLGSQCDRVIVTPSSTIGSVGIYVSFVDESAKFKSEGKKVIVIKSGDFKGAGIEGLPLTQQQGDLIQSEVIDLHDIFKDTVKRSRSLVKDDDMQGQTFSGIKAAQKGLATGLANSFDEFLRQFEGSGDDVNINASGRSTANSLQPTQTRLSPTRKVR